MVIDAERADEIKKVFRQVYDSRDEAKILTASANDLLKGLALRIAGDGDSKVIQKALKKAYSEWKADHEGEADSLVDALDILTAIGG
jgi:hypothetical protein